MLPHYGSDLNLQQGPYIYTNFNNNPHPDDGNNNPHPDDGRAFINNESPAIIRLFPLHILS